MRPLSDTRRARAVAYGHAVALDHLRDYAENPSNFPKGLPSLPGLTERMARAGIGLTGRAVTEAEKDAASDAARDLVALVMDVAERWAKESLTTSQDAGRRDA